MFCIEIYNGYDVSYLSAKTERFIKSRKYAKRFSTYDEAKTELKITQKSCISFWVIKETKHKHKKGSIIEKNNIRYKNLFQAY